jgi:hypothetical protein
MIAPTLGQESANGEENRDEEVARPCSEEVGEATGEKQEDEDDDDVTVIMLDQRPDEGGRFTIAWQGEAGPQVEERRRNIMLQELQRVQRTSFLHFLILCLIPTVLLFIVIATVVSEDEECYSEATVCHKEARNFINAFTTRCVCEAIAVPRLQN